MKLKLSCIIGAAMFVSLLSPIAKAETSAPAESEEQLLFMEIPSVTSTGFFAQDKDKAPGSVYLISNSQIEYGTPRTIGELLNVYVPGISMSWHSWTGPPSVTAD